MSMIRKHLFSLKIKGVQIAQVVVFNTRTKHIGVTHTWSKRLPEIQI